MNYRIGESPKRPQRNRIQTNGYPWPASRLNAEDMHKLHLLRLQTKKPITKLIQEAVQTMSETFLHDESDSSAAGIVEEGESESPGAAAILVETPR